MESGQARRRKRVNGRMILLPVMVQVILTMVVYILLNFAKVRATKRGEVNQARRGLHDDAWPQSVIKINNNIRNQFEVPVLFYVLSFELLALNAVTIPVIAIAWLFVLSRIVHAYIHIGRNHVPSRRKAFMFGCVMLVALAVMAAFALATG
jgi:hypothetical protein